MKKTVCDLCDSGEALEPQTGMYLLIVRRIIEDRDITRYHETEYDACGACMAKLGLEGKS